MPQIEVGYQVPIQGDGRWLSQKHSEFPPTWSYLSSIAKAAERYGFDTVLVPVTFRSTTFGIHEPIAESWTAGTGLAAATERIRILVAIRPGFVNPGLMALMSATFDDIAPGRLAFNVVTAGAPGDMESFGDTTIDHDGRYRRAAEFVDIMRRLWTEESVSVEGEFYHLDGAVCWPKPKVLPPFYLAGASPAAKKMAAAQADVYLMSAEPVEGIKRRIDELSEMSGGRPMRFGVAATVICRRTSEEAWAHAQAILDHADPEVMARTMGGSPDRMPLELARFRAMADDEMKMGRNLWAGFSKVSTASAYVGSAEEIAELLHEYAKAGVSYFQFYAHPHLEEVQRVAEELLPLIRGFGSRLESAA